MNNKLYIIGNGFDLHHNLDTRYLSYQLFISNQNNELDSFYEEYFNFRNENDSEWTYFEEDLGTFNHKAFFDNNNYIDTTYEGFKPSMLFALEDDLVREAERVEEMMRKSFFDWLNGIDIYSIEENKRIDLNPNSKYFSFNYTSVLESFYNIPNKNIMYIHGNLHNNVEDIIIGHQSFFDSTPELDEKGDSNRTIFTDSEHLAKIIFDNFFKPVEILIDIEKQYFEELKDITEIIVLGHSLNDIDILYFKEISKRTRPDAKWVVSYYEAEELNTHKNKIINIGIETSRISMIKITDLQLNSPKNNTIG